MQITEHVVQQYKKRFKCNTHVETEIKEIIQKKLDKSKTIQFPRLYKKEDDARYQINGRCVFVIMNNKVVTVLNKADMSNKKRQKLNKIG